MSSLHRAWARARRAIEEYNAEVYRAASAAGLPGIPEDAFIADPGNASYDEGAFVELAGFEEEDGEDE